MKRKPIIRLHNVTKSFGTARVLNGVSLDILPGQTTVIIGPSGSGKSVLLKHIPGLLRPDSGQVFYHDEEISAMSERQLAYVRRRMGFLFQGSALFDSMTAEENILFPLQEHGVGELSHQKKRVAEVLSLVGLDGIQRQYPEELSGGQKKRVALARAIALGPEIVLYDEPTTGLDPIRADLINELIIRLRSALNITSIVVTHDMHSARRVGDRIVMLYDGQFIADTTPALLGEVDNDTVCRFVQGRASSEELAELRSGHLISGRAGVNEVRSRDERA